MFKNLEIRGNLESLAAGIICFKSAFNNLRTLREVEISPVSGHFSCNGVTSPM
jgi:hypothetical protein